VKKYKLTPAAKEDLIDVWNYTLEKWGLPQAEKYLLGIETQLEKLADNPDLGKHRREIHSGYYSFPVNKHVVFYLKAVDHIQIIGILPCRMDVDSRLL
jgi:toxin ParE1/3/4